MVCPLISTQFSKMDAWYHHYFCSLGVALVVSTAHSLILVVPCISNALTLAYSRQRQNFVFLLYVIRLRTETSLLGSHPDEVLATQEGGEVADSSSKMRDIIKSKTVGLFALFT